MAGVTFLQGSGLNDPHFGKIQAPIKMHIERSAEQFEKLAVTPLIFVENNSENWAEAYTSDTAHDDFVPTGENGNYPQGGKQSSYSKIIANETWKNSFHISREAVDDNKIVDLKQKPEGFVASYHRTREKFGAALLAGAISGKEKVAFKGMMFDVTAADGMTYFNKEHKSILEDNKKTQSNQFKDAFSVDALGAMESAMHDFRGDNDEILTVSPDTIVIPNDYALKKAVFEAIGSDKDPATANNGFNYQFGRWNVIVWQYLNQFLAKGLKPWVLLDQEYNKMVNAAVWQNRVPLEVRSEIDHNDANVWKGYARFSAGFVDWRAMAVGGITSGTQLIS